MKELMIIPEPDTEEDEDEVDQIKWIDRADAILAKNGGAQDEREDEDEEQDIDNLLKLLQDKTTVIELKTTYLIQAF